MNNGTWEKRLLTHSLPLKQKPGRKNVNLELQLWRENLSVAISLTEGSNLNCRDFLALFQANFLKDDYKSFECLRQDRSRSERVLKSNLFQVVCVVAESPQLGIERNGAQASAEEILKHSRAIRVIFIAIYYYTVISMSQPISTPAVQQTHSIQNCPQLLTCISPHKG